MKFTISRPPGYVLSAVAISLGGFLNGYDTGSIGAVTEMPFFATSIGELTPFLRGFTVSLIMLTGAFPSFFAGQLADRFGRLAIVAAGALVFAIGAALEGGANKLGMFLAGRALCGVGEGLWLSNVSVYITEIAPSARRGMLVSMPQFMACAGICAGYFTCYGSVRVESSFSWRAPFIIQAVLGVALATMPLVLPQSPRWLLLHGHREQAIEALKSLDFSAVEAEKDLLGPAAEQQMAVRQPGPVEGLTMLFRQPYRKPALLALYVLGVIQLSGIDGVLYYAPTLFAQAGIDAKTSSFLASGLSAILILAISIPALLLADKVSRRSSVIVGGCILTFCMFTIGTLYASNSVTPQNPARWLVIILVFVFGLAYSATWGIVGKIYASEIQPAATRSAASAVAQGLGFFTNWIVAIITPVLLAKSSYGAYFLFGGICLASVLVLMLSMPETRGLSLEAIQEAFLVPGTAQRGRVVSMLRRWAGLGSAESLSTGSNSQASESAIELRDVGDLLNQGTANNGAEAASLDDNRSGGAVRV
ncbi:general substrate transporter [Aureobasidium sp. EXF-12298]|nr:general substrate transporter [Aureobasidium sp. EXF-12298]KAI4758817.1 general substrate transporter [Aureobasidium sp. EXF-12344]KAI4776084.1 general substrate transporter [Aureobasidium sp. EXF-3400]